MSEVSKGFDYITLDEAFERLDSLPPQTYVEMGEGLKIKRKANGIPVMRIHYDAIPERNRTLHPEWAIQERKAFTTRGWRREQEIDDMAGGGEKLFADLLAQFNDVIVITDPFWYPDPAWDVVGGFDHGKTNATVLEKAYIDFDGSIICAGEFYQMKTETYANNIWQNVPTLNEMPHLDRMRWCRADPSIFWDKEAQEDGTYQNINAIYRKLGFKRLTTFPTEIPREDLTFEERLNDHWQNLGENKPTLRIVCRNALDRRQPGLHKFDSPNLLWELWRMKRKELSAKQLIEKNPTEKIVDKDNHAWDALKYMVMSLPRPSRIPLERKIKEILKNLDPMSAQIRIGQVLKQDQQQTVRRPLNLRGRPMLKR